MQRFLLLPADRLPGRFGHSLHGENPFQRRERVGVIPHRPLHGGQDVSAVIGLQQQQHALGLMFAATLLLQHSFQEADGHLTQFGVSLAEQLELLTLVAGRPMGWLQLTLAGLTNQQQVLSHLPNLVIINEQFPLADPHRQQLTDQLPGCGVLVITVVDATFRIDDAIHDFCRVVITRRKRQQVWQFLGVCIDGTFLGRAMRADVGHVGQPPPRDLVQVFQTAEAATIEQARFHIVKRSFHFTFGLGTPRTTGPRPEAIVRGERQEAGVVDRLAVLPPRDDHLHVVVQALGRQTSQMPEGPDVLADRGLEVLPLGKTEILSPRVT